MKKVAIVGVEGSGKTVMLAGLGELYSRPDQDGYFLMPKNFKTANYVQDKIARMRGGEWPTATAEDVLQGLDWTLKRRQQGGRPETICEISCLDFAGEVYRAAFGIRSEGGTGATNEVQALKDYIRQADELIVLINLRDVITRGIDNPRVQEAMWITNSILSVALDETGDRQPPRAMIALSQADSYAETITACGGAKGVLEQYLPYVANNYDWLDVVAVSAVDRTVMDDEGNVVPAPDFTPGGLKPLLAWIIGAEVSAPPPEELRPEYPSSRKRGRVVGLLLVLVALVGGWLWHEKAKANRQAKLAKSEVERLEAEVVRQQEGVQLWENGPYWAECNVGAAKPEECGYYFWWGDTVGYKRENGFGGDRWVAVDGSRTDFKFSRENCPTDGKDESQLRAAGYIDSTGNLVAKHDAATAHLGAPWRMPTAQEVNNLIRNCTTEWTMRNGVTGRLVTGKGRFSTKSIFFPAAGYGADSRLNYLGSYGSCWSSTPDSGKSYYAWSLNLNSGDFDRNYSDRNFGQSVRPVRGFAQ